MSRAPREPQGYYVVDLGVSRRFDPVFNQAAAKKLRTKVRAAFGSDLFLEVGSNVGVVPGRLLDAEARAFPSTLPCSLAVEIEKRNAVAKVPTFAEMRAAQSAHLETVKGSEELAEDAADFLVLIEEHLPLEATSHVVPEDLLGTLSLETSEVGELFEFEGSYWRPEAIAPVIVAAFRTYNAPAEGGAL